MCLNNWGGVSHQILEFNEYVNLFSGKSGSGKSTVMDAIQVILYGSFNSNFLNKAADDAKNKRNVLNYLRGEQKDGTANREGVDFCSTIALEIEDTGSHSHTCVGAAFEVKKTDAEIKKYIFFSHSGKIPEDEYLTEEGYVYTNANIRRLVDNRSKSDDNRGYDVNKIYGSKEAYLGALYDVILGYIDGTRFQTMEKSAIALKMTNGTGQFIRDYMFPKSESNVIEKISDQLGSYRDIQEKIKDLARRIELLRAVKEAGDRKLEVSTGIVKTDAQIKCIDIVDLRAKIEAGSVQISDSNANLKEIKDLIESDDEILSELDNELVRVLADLKSSDLGAKQDQLLHLERQQKMLEESSGQWRRVTSDLRKWEEDEIATDYVSNPMLNKINLFLKGSVSASQCEELRKSIKSTQENIKEALDEYKENFRQLNGRIKELRILVDDIQNDRKPYRQVLKEARGELENKLCDMYGRRIKVNIFADLFDVSDKEWKNAIEGRLGRIKLSLVTEPQYAKDAAALFREMKKYEEVDLINTDAIVRNDSMAQDNSLYEAVETTYPYIDTCLKHYLGRIIKCRTNEELWSVRDGVTPDCYSYSNFTFRHLRRNDYDKYACIGTKVSKAKLAQYQEELSKLEIESTQLKRLIDGLEGTAEFEHLNNDDEYFVSISRAGKELGKVLKETATLRQEISLLKEGRFKELNAQKIELENKKREINEERTRNQLQVSDLERLIGQKEGELSKNKEMLDEKRMGYIRNEEIENLVMEEMKKRSGQAIKSKLSAEIESLKVKETEEDDNLNLLRGRFNREYPSLGFSGSERSNDVYVNLLNDYENNFEPKYEKEFEEKCIAIYKSLRENVIATIHGDINAAKRHTREINRLLRKTNFADSTYQIKIEPAKNENGQFYDMLTAIELDGKNVGADVVEGQISLGDDEFYQKYENKIKLLTDKFMPIRGEDGDRREQRLNEMKEYADYRNYLSFSMYEQVTDKDGNVIRENFVDEMAGRDSGGEGQNPKYVALLAGFAMLYMQQSNRDSKIKLVLLDEAFSKMDQERSAVCLKYARQMDLQLIVCVPDERLQSLIRNVDCVYGFRRFNNRISMMHIDKGEYLKLMEGDE
jgi:uncharacterized protein YPO0396